MGSESMDGSCYFRTLMHENRVPEREQVDILLEYVRSVGADRSLAAFARERVALHGAGRGMGVFEDYSGPDNPGDMGGPFSPWGGRR